MLLQDKVWADGVNKLLIQLSGANRAMAIVWKNTFFNNGIIVTSSIRAPFVILSYLCCRYETANDFTLLSLLSDSREIS